MRVVLDTNVLLSALMFPESVPGRIVGAWREARFDLVTSVAQFGEVGRVLAYPNIRRVLKWDDETIERFLRQLYLRAEVVDSGTFAFQGLRDASDAHVLGSLVQSRADLLVTGDQDLLALKNRFPIASPAEFVRTL